MSVDVEVATGLRGRALLVDDEDLVCASTADMLEGLGFPIIEPASAEEALRTMRRREPFGALVADHLMRGVSSVDLARNVLTTRVRTNGFANRWRVHRRTPLDALGEKIGKTCCFPSTFGPFSTIWEI